MADTTYVTLRATNDQPFDEREIVAEGFGVVARKGTAVEVPTAIAGKAPKGKPGEDGYDPGAGLLAQTDVWRPANKSEQKAAEGRETEQEAPALTGQG